MQFLIGVCLGLGKVSSRIWDRRDPTAKLGCEYQAGTGVAGRVGPNSRLMLGLCRCSECNLSRRIAEEYNSSIKTLLLLPRVPVGVVADYTER